jgi:hypothetical protein
MNFYTNIIYFNSGFCCNNASLDLLEKELYIPEILYPPFFAGYLAKLFHCRGYGASDILMIDEY